MFVIFTRIIFLVFGDVATIESDEAQISSFKVDVSFDGCVFHRMCTMMFYDKIFIFYDFFLAVIACFPCFEQTIFMKMFGMMSLCSQEMLQIPS